jgi:CHAT domain-containing protein
LHEAWANRAIAAKNSTYSSGSLPTAAFNLAQPSKPSTAIKFNNSVLNQRGFPGQLASLTEGLRQCPSPIGQGFLYRELGEAHWDQGRAALYTQSNPAAARDAWREARRAYDQALAALEAPTNANDPTCTDQYLQALKGQLRIYLALHLPGSTIETLERRGTSFVDRLLAAATTDDQRRRIQLQYSSFRQTTVDRLLRQGDPIAALATAEADKNSLISWLLHRQPQDQAYDYDQLRQLLRPGLAVVYWHLSADALTTFVLRHDVAEPIVLLPESPLRQALQLTDWLDDWNSTYQTAIGNLGEAQSDPWIQALPSKLARLATLLDLPALEPHLQGISQLLLIPHRDLHRLPIATLLSRADRTCTTLPSLRVALNLNHQPQAPIGQPLLVISDPTHSDPTKTKTTTPLYHASLESRGLRGLFPQGETLARTEVSRRALETTLVRTPSGILHFNGHASYNFEDPRDTFLPISGTDRLSLGDLLNLSLS